MKNVLITGASGGIGTALAKAFAKEGHQVALHGFHEIAQAEALANSLQQTYGINALAVRADVADSAQVGKMVRHIQDAFGGIDVLINNAGIAQQKLFTELTDEDWETMISVNLGGVFRCCRAVLPEMIRRHAGTILNISSMWGQIGGSCEVAYSAAKAGVIGLTKALAKEVGLSGITVNCIAPGVIRTKMLASFTQEDLASLADDTPLNRLGTPEDIAGAAVFLCSEHASYITGQILGVNGGFVI